MCYLYFFCLHCCLISIHIFDYPDFLLRSRRVRIIEVRLYRFFFLLREVNPLEKSELAFDFISADFDLLRLQKNQPESTVRHKSLPNSRPSWSVSNRIASGQLATVRWFVIVMSFIYCVMTTGDSNHLIGCFKSTLFLFYLFFHCFNQFKVH